MVLKRLGVLSVGKMLGCVYGLMGLIAGSVMSLITIGMGAGGGFGGAGGAEAILFGAGAITALPFIYGTMGFIGGMIAAVFYNICARLVGGIEVEFVQTLNDDVI